jgi:WD40 repeat protein
MSLSNKRIALSFVLIFIASLGIVDAQTSFIEQVEWNSDGTRLLLAYNTEILKVVDTNNQVILEHSLSEGGIFQNAEWHPTNPNILAVAEDNLGTMLATVSLIDVTTEQLIISTHPGVSVRAIAWSPNGNSIAIGVGYVVEPLLSRYIEIWNIETNRIDGMIQYNESEITALSWNPDGSRLASSALDSRIVVWDAATGQEVYAITTPTIMHNMAWSPDGSRIASGSFGYTRGIWIWNAATGQNLLSIPNASAFDLEWNSDSKRFAAGSLLNGVEIWDATTGQILSTIPSATPIYDVAWNPDGTSLALASNIEFPLIIHFPTVTTGDSQ